MQQNLCNLKIGILGLGLIGGSIFKSLSANGFTNIRACSSNTATIKEIQKSGFEASDNVEILNDCDIIFICAPISETKAAIEKVFKVNKNAIIADVASLKADILNFAENIEGCKFIGTHPLAGTEFSGFKAAFADLFKKATWVVIPTSQVTISEVKTLKEIIACMKANAVEMDSDEHDKAVALISHLPMLLAESLVSISIDNTNALQLASSGFRDTTRLALTNKTLAKDMLQLNSKNIKNALQLLADEVNKLMTSDYFDERINKIIEVRQSLYDENGKNSFKNNC